MALSPSYLGHPEQHSQAQPLILNPVSTETDISNRQSPSFQIQVSSKTCSHMTHRLHNCQAIGALDSVPPSTSYEEGNRRYTTASWLPVQCSSLAAPNPGGPAAILPISLGLSVPIHPYSEEKVPEVNTCLLSTSDNASSVPGSPEQWVRGGGTGSLTPANLTISKAPAPRLMSLEPKTCSLVTEGWGPVSEDIGGSE